MKKLILAIALLSVTAWAQSIYQGAGNVQGQITFGPPTTTPPPPTSDEDAYCALGDVPIGGGTDGPATLPTQCIHTGLDGSPSLGATINATNTAAFAAALTSAACGDKIVLTAGTVYQGTFTIPAKSCNPGQWITIKSTGVADASFPAEGVRATPCEIGIGVPGPIGYPPYACANAGARMAIIESAANGTAEALSFASGANFYRFIGIAIRKQPGSAKINKKLVTLTSSDHIIFDRYLCYGEAWKPIPEADDESQGCFNMNNSTYLGFVNGWAYDTYCMGTCKDSGAFAGAGTGSLIPLGPVKIYNNLMATAGESVILGGGGNFPQPTAVAHDFEIRRNHSFKPLTWMLEVAGPTGGSADLHVINKNLLELKNGDRFLVEGNVFENSWHGWQTDQTGNGITLTPKNQNNNASVTVNISGSTVTSSTATADFADDMVISAPGCTPPGTAPHYCGCPVDPADGVRRCILEIEDTSRSDNGAKYRIATVAADLKSITLTTPTDGGNSTGVNANACHPGDSPDAYVRNVTVRYNWIRNVTNGFQIATAVSSHCNDEANGLDTIMIHDNVIDGIEDTMSNGNGPNTQSRGLDTGNGVFGSPLKNLTVRHNTVTILHAGAASISGLMKDGDAHDGVAVPLPPGVSATILRGYDIRDNIATGGIVTVSGQGARMTGGPLAGLNVHHCVTHTNTYTAGGTVPAGSLPDPALVGSPSEPNCSWRVERNLIGTNQWTNQSDQTPANYPATNQTCGISAATCFLDGAAYGAIFTNFNGGYLGNYRLAGPTYKGQGTDGEDLGADIDTLQLKIAGVAPPPLQNTLSITTTTLPNVGVNIPYPLTTLTATNVNSPFKEWTLVSGALPPGMTMSRGGRLAWLGVANVQRIGNLVTLTCPENINAGSFISGQKITVEGFVNFGAAPVNGSTDATLNGTFTLVTANVNAGTYTYNQTGADIPAHAMTVSIVSYVPTVRFGPTTAGTSNFTVKARDGAKQTATQALTLTVTGGISHTVDLTWTVSTTPGTTSRVYRSTTSGTFAGVAIGTGITGNTFTDSTVANGTTYFYIIRSFDGANESANSNQATAVIP